MTKQISKVEYVEFRTGGFVRTALPDTVDSIEFTIPDDFGNPVVLALNVRSCKSGVEIRAVNGNLIISPSSGNSVTLHSITTLQTLNGQQKAFLKQLKHVQKTKIFDKKRRAE